MNNDTKADFHAHHIEGYANAVFDRGDPESSHFDVPLISHIEGNLWMGDFPGKGVRLDDDFKHVVSLYPREQYALGPNTKRIEFLLYDGAEIPEERTLGSIVRYVNRCLEDGPTLVHCQAGLNRSGLISALSLIERGWDPMQAIGLLREKRHALVLCNKAFEEYLLCEGCRPYGASSATA